MATGPGRVAARAKLNLFLHVTGRRGDGCHTLSSLVVRLDLADRLRLAPAAADRLRLLGPFACALAGEAEAGNLALRAVRAARELAGGGPPLAVSIDKQLPVAAGLGGGSADAAAALAAAAKLFGARAGGTAFEAAAAALGADVPACLRSGPVAVSGIGDMVVPAPPLPSFALVLVNPRVRLATAEVFRAFAGPFSDAMPLERSPAGPAALAAELALRRNDLEAPATRLVPEIGEALAMLAAASGVLLARMSGSGATCFGIVADLGAAESVAASLRRQRPDWWIAATRTARSR